MKCSNCGKEIKNIMLKMSIGNGDSYWTDEPIKNNDMSVSIFTDSMWAGYELTTEEQKDLILCPYCRGYPFGNKIQVYDVVEIACYK